MLYTQRPPWRKNLYENAEYEDNYTDPSFLKDLRTNINARFFTLGEAIRGVTRLNNQISCVTGFLIVFYLLYSEEVTPSRVLLPTTLMTAVGYAIYRGGHKLHASHLVEDSKTLLTVLLFGYIFAPLLHGLTNAISTDTIFSMTFVVMLLNLIFCDYGLSVAMVSKALSLNAAVFGAICLASRLSTSYHAFVLLVEAAIFFVLYPIFVSLHWRWQLLPPIVCVCCYLLFFISRTVLCVYMIVTGFVNFICPWIFVVQQRHKNNIHGPWDEAIVQEHTDTSADTK